LVGLDGLHCEARPDFRLRARVFLGARPKR
jgi:hypothetical protein